MVGLGVCAFMCVWGGERGAVHMAPAARVAGHAVFGQDWVGMGYGACNVGAGVAAPQSVRLKKGTLC